MDRPNVHTQVVTRNVPMQTDDSSGPEPFAFLLRRWRRQVPIATLFWRDMILFGSIINIVAGAMGLLMLGLKAGLMLSLLVLFAPLPANIILLIAVWRAADIAGARQAVSYRSGAVLWFLAATVI